MLIVLPEAKPKTIATNHMNAVVANFVQRWKKSAKLHRAKITGTVPHFLALAQGIIRPLGLINNTSKSSLMPNVVHAFGWSRTPFLF